MKRTLSLPLPHGRLLGDLDLPDLPRALILLVRARPLAPDGIFATALADRGYAVLQFPLLTEPEARYPDAGMNIPKLTQRLLDILQLLRNDGDVAELPLALLASGEATPAAIRAAARRDKQVCSLVCLGGLADRAGIESLEALQAPLLMLSTPEEVPAQHAFERARLHLHGEHQAETGVIGYMAGTVAAWFARTLN